MSQPLDDSPEASSSTAAEKAISTLRARLRSEDPLPPPLHASASSSEPCLKHNDIYKQLRATFSSLPGPQPAPHHTLDRGNTIMNNLAETFARSGEDAYKSAVSDIQTVHKSISGRIDAFHAESASALSDAAALYDNFSYPLSRTVCHSENFPRGTIAQHLSVLKDKMDAAEKRLASLNEEWMACVDQEAKIMAVTEAVDDSDSAKEVDALVQEIDDIVKDKAAELEQMEKEYRDLLWKESQKMMQAMMAD
ncbi:hypothetical protein H634G_08189 [Metarhizium anisopliae BRIP 53293]|uniref:Uncharacterized protein n=1 Tax=Metarhizium anisopliae BRIP 53293 TaxID=1291518 RepID=A0A0D9NRZ5_METAN|nr:hypothetical protein H634G_08189 [Metarhizium anisopliae BRIP 53293]KJK87978.1 hypothetical protein H633G_08150 [Metarhizium anisopliae BRIP 53284]